MTGRFAIHERDMDLSARPQDDFYRYANGGWMKRNAIPKNESRWGSFMMLRYKTDRQVKAIVEGLLSLRSAKKGSPEQLIRDFYRSGLDMKRRSALGVKPLTPLLTRIAKLQRPEELTALFADFSILGMGVPLGIGIDQDAKDTTVYILHLFQDGLALPDRDYYLLDEKEFVRVRTAYAPHVEAVLRLGGSSAKKAKEEARIVIAFETKLAKVSMNKVERREIDKTYNVRTLKELNRMAPNIAWGELFKRIGAPQAKKAVVMQPKFVQAVSGFVTAIPLEEWKVYLRFQVLNDFAGTLSASFYRQQFSFYGKVLTGAKAPKPLWRRTVNAINGYVGEPLGKLYVRKHFTAQAKRKMNELVDDLFDAYRIRIKGLDWMSPQTKKKALQKLSAMTRKIGYPDKWKSFAGLVISPDDFVGNIMRAATFAHRRDMKKLRKPVDRSEWYCDPQVVNAFNAPNLNDITFPAAILQPPFFDLHGDAALNYGCIGAVIGHEITHSFDDEGAKFDAKGNLKNWWTKADKKKFEAKAALVVKQFNTYEVADGVKVNGKLTLGENIADFGGLSIAYDAYQRYLKHAGRKNIKSMTPEQRFFLGFALFERENLRPEFEKMITLTDPHSPGKYRINGPLANFEKFYEAYNVKKSDKLWRDPSIRTMVW